MPEETLGQRIARLRKEKRMTQADLAAIMHVTDKAVSKWERDVACPDVASLFTLASALGVSIEGLMTAKAEEITPESFTKVTGTILGIVTIAYSAFSIVIWRANQLPFLLDTVSILAIGIAIWCFQKRAWQENVWDKAVKVLVLIVGIVEIIWCLLTGADMIWGMAGVPFILLGVRLLCLGKPSRG